MSCAMQWQGPNSYNSNIRRRPTCNEGPMRFKLIMVYVTLMALCVSLSACKKMAESEEAESSAATVEHLNGDGPARVTLTEDAAKRLDVQTAPIQESDVNGAKQKAMPYSALLYDTKG